MQLGCCLQERNKMSKRAGQALIDIPKFCYAPHGGSLRVLAGMLDDHCTLLVSVRQDVTAEASAPIVLVITSILTVRRSYQTMIATSLKNLSHYFCFLRRAFTRGRVRKSAKQTMVDGRYCWGFMLSLYSALRGRARLKYLTLLVHASVE